MTRTSTLERLSLANLDGERQYLTLDWVYSFMDQLNSLVTCSLLNLMPVDKLLAYDVSGSTSVYQHRVSTSLKREMISEKFINCEEQ